MNQLVLLSFYSRGNECLSSSANFNSQNGMDIDRTHNRLYLSISIPVIVRFCELIKSASRHGGNRQKSWREGGRLGMTPRVFGHSVKLPFETLNTRAGICVGSVSPVMTSSRKSPGME